MSIRIVLAAGYMTTTLLGSVCPLQMAAALPMSEPIHHVEMAEVALTPTMPMTLAVPRWMDLALYTSLTLPMLPSGNCTMGHCLVMEHSDQQNSSALFSSIVQLKVAASPPMTIVPVRLSMVSLPAPPEGDTLLTSTISTIVLRV